MSAPSLLTDGLGLDPELARLPFLALALPSAANNPRKRPEAKRGWSILGAPAS